MPNVEKSSIVFDKRRSWLAVPGRVGAKAAAAVMALEALAGCIGPDGNDTTGADVSLPPPSISTYTPTTGNPFDTTPSTTASTTTSEPASTTTSSAAPTTTASRTTTAPRTTTAAPTTTSRAPAPQPPQANTDTVTPDLGSSVPGQCSVGGTTTPILLGLYGPFCDEKPQNAVTANGEAMYGPSQSNGEKVKVVCQFIGQAVTGGNGLTSNVWDSWYLQPVESKTGRGQYVYSPDVLLQAEHVVNGSQCAPGAAMNPAGANPAG